METAWLIDATSVQMSLGANGSEYLLVPYSSPHVIRFARKEDAERVIQTGAFIWPPDEIGAKNSFTAVEHAWCTF